MSSQTGKEDMPRKEVELSLQARIEQINRKREESRIALAQWEAAQNKELDEEEKRIRNMAEAIDVDDVDGDETVATVEVKDDTESAILSLMSDIDKVIEKEEAKRK